jgi:predicted HNH restriction endonuclease
MTRRKRKTRRLGAGDELGVLARYGWRCAHCGAAFSDHEIAHHRFHLHHVLPWQQHGVTHPAVMVPVHIECHKLIHGRPA